jgi:hypothetical protein
MGLFLHYSNGSASHGQSGRLGEASERLFEPLGQIFDVLRRPVRDLHPEVEAHAFEHLLTEERGKTTRLPRTRQKVARVGMQQTLADWAVATQETDGFRMLLDRGMPELSGEAVILRNADHFAPDMVAAARARLELAGVDPRERKREIIDADEAEKAARDETMTTQRREEVERTDKAFEKVEKEAETKRPSLLKAGETVGDPAPGPPRKKK